MLQVMSPLPASMRATALHHTGVVGELTMLRATVSSAAELEFCRLPCETSREEVMNKVTTKFHELEELCSRLKGLGAWIYNLLHGASPD
jgi:hypothetical protein